MGIVDVAWLGREHGRCVVPKDDIHLQAGELGGDFGKAIAASFRPAVLDSDRAALGPTELTLVAARKQRSIGAAP